MSLRPIALAIYAWHLSRYGVGVVLFVWLYRIMSFGANAIRIADARRLRSLPHGWCSYGIAWLAGRLLRFVVSLA